jgi:hypothetical protein
MKIKHVLFGALVAGAAVGLLPPTAGADPKLPPISLTCGSTTEQVVVAGGGAFTPAHSTATTKIYIPVSFGTSTATVRDLTGAIVGVFPGDTPGVKGKKGTGVQDTQSCTYTFTFLSDGSDPEGPPEGYSITIAGEVTGFSTPR